MRSRLITLGILAALSCALPACGSGSGSGSGAATGGGSGSGSGGDDGGAAEQCAAVDGEAVRFTTSDGVELEADLHTTGATHAPAAVLLHMIPPANSRANYPPGFRAALVQRGLNVLNVDRRGAGASGGIAKEAYEGPNGKLDAAAAMQFLLSHPCGADPTKLVLVGASNGTTTALDYTVWASSDADAPMPAALVFLTGGSYTENQNSVTDQRSLLEPLPMLFVYSKDERAWSAGFEDGAPGGWKFREYDPGAHGTRMFDTRPEAIAEVADFIASAVGTGG